MEPFYTPQSPYVLYDFLITIADDENIVLEWYDM